MTEDELLHIEQVSELTRIPIASLRYMKSRNEGPRAFKLGRRLVYRRSDVDRWIEERYDAAEAERVAR